MRSPLVVFDWRSIRSRALRALGWVVVGAALGWFAFRRDPVPPAPPSPAVVKDMAEHGFTPLEHTKHVDTPADAPKGEAIARIVTTSSWTKAKRDPAAAAGETKAAPGETNPPAAETCSLEGLELRCETDTTILEKDGWWFTRTSWKASGRIPPSADVWTATGIGEPVKQQRATSTLPSSRHFGFLVGGSLSVDLRPGLEAGVLSRKAGRPGWYAMGEYRFQTPTEPADPRIHGGLWWGK